MHLKTFRELSNNRNGCSTFAGLWVGYSAIPNRTRNVHFSIAIVLPQKPTNLSVSQLMNAAIAKAVAAGSGSSQRMLWISSRE